MPFKHTTHEEHKHYRLIGGFLVSKRRVWTTLGIGLAMFGLGEYLHYTTAAHGASILLVAVIDKLLD